MRRLNLRDESGTSPASVIMMLVWLMMMAELVVLGGRVAAAHNNVTGAAREAARQASVLQYDASVAGVADEVARANLDSTLRHCRTPAVDSSKSSFSAGGQVTVEVTCVVELSDLSILTVPWPTMSISAEVTEIVETYRAVE